MSKKFSSFKKEQRVWESDVFDDVYNLEDFKQDPGRVIRSILRHIEKKY